MARTPRDPLERYREKVNVRGPDECWEWTAARFSSGYGAFRLGDRQVKAHRFGYEALVGPIPHDVYVCHTCDNPPCQNPRHWFLGTHRDNAHDRERKGRGRYRTTGPIRRVKPGRALGERHGRAKLTSETVRSIRSRYGAGESQDAIAAAFGVSQRTIHLIVRGKTWKHVP